MENALKGTEAILGETHDQLESERMRAANLQKAFEDLHAFTMVENEEAAKAVVATFKSSKAFEDVILEYYISSFETLR